MLCAAGVKFCHVQGDKCKCRTASWKSARCVESSTKDHTHHYQWHNNRRNMAQLPAKTRLHGTDAQPQSSSALACVCTAKRVQQTCQVPSMVAQLNNGIGTLNPYSQWLHSTIVDEVKYAHQWQRSDHGASVCCSTDTAEKQHVQAAVCTCPVAAHAAMMVPDAPCKRCILLDQMSGTQCEEVQMDKAKHEDGTNDCAATVLPVPRVHPNRPV